MTLVYIAPYSTFKNPGPAQVQKQRLTQIENVKCQSPNAKSNPNVK
jgi:hypothetical protein